MLGPNLRDESLGEFHVHADGCRDVARYGPGRPMGGDSAPLVLDVESVEELAGVVYADMLDEDQDMTRIGLVSGFHLAPCVNLPVACPYCAPDERCARCL